MHSGRNISIKTGCSRQCRCIRTVFNVSFSQRFTSGHLTQICSMQRGSFIPSRASRSSSFGVRNAFPPCLFRHISSRSTARIATSINNRSTKFELSSSSEEFFRRVRELLTGPFNKRKSLWLSITFLFSFVHYILHSSAFVFLFVNSSRSRSVDRCFILDILETYRTHDLEVYSIHLRRHTDTSIQNPLVRETNGSINQIQFYRPNVKLVVALKLL